VQELKLKGIDTEIIQSTLIEVLPADDECAAAMKAAEKKLKTMTAIPPDARNRRLAGFLDRKGFSAEIIRNILRQGIDRGE
jgi:SOS response regulatory protein OraA/RecX